MRKDNSGVKKKKKEWIIKRLSYAYMMEYYIAVTFTHLEQYI